MGPKRTVCLLWLVRVRRPDHLSGEPAGVLRRTDEQLVAAQEGKLHAERGRHEALRNRLVEP